MLDDYTTVTSVPLQWGDMDAFGHINNVVYIQWFESARIDLIASYNADVSMKPSGVGPILAAVRCNYKRQLHFPDTVHVGSRIERIGRTSVDIGHAVFSEQLQQVAATGTSVVVIFDYASNRPQRIPQSLIDQMEVFSAE